MIKKVLFLGLCVLELNASDIKTWTVVLSTTSTLENAESFVSKYVKTIPNIEIIKVNDKKYRVIYGNYNNYNKAKSSLNKLPEKLLISGPYVKSILIKDNITKETTTSKLTTIQENIKTTIKHTQNLNSENKPWTIILSTTRNLKNAKAFANKYTDILSNIEIVKIHDNRYTVNYNRFATYSDAKKALYTLPSKIKISGPYIQMQKITNYEIEEINTDNPADELNIDKEDIKPNEIVIEKLSEQSTTMEYKDPVKSITSVNHDKTTNLLMQEIKYQAELEYADIKINGNFKFGENGTSVDISNDLGISNTKGTIIPKVSIKVDAHQGYMSYATNSYSSDNTLKKSITIDNYTYNQGEKINTSIDTNLWIVGYKYNYLLSNIGFNLNFYNNNMKISSSKSKTVIELDYIFPSLTFDMVHKIKQFDFTYGLSYGLSNDVNSFSYYLGFGKELCLIENSNISLEYKSKDFDINDDNFNGKLNYDGIGLKFNKTF